MLSASPGEVGTLEARRPAALSPMRPGTLQRSCASCGGSAHDGQCGCHGRKLSSRGRRAPDLHALRAAAAVVNSPGRPLDGPTRAFMERRFGHDFSRVRVHADGRATESASRLDARAYTVGRDVVFGAGRYEPHTSAGRRLLAHELSHVVQQGGVKASAVSDAGPRDGAAEREADLSASAVVAGSPGPPALTRTAPRLSRQSLDENEEERREQQTGAASTATPGPAGTIPAGVTTAGTPPTDEAHPAAEAQPAPMFGVPPLQVPRPGEPRVPGQSRSSTVLTPSPWLTPPATLGESPAAGSSLRRGRPLDLTPGEDQRLRLRTGGAHVAQFSRRVRRPRPGGGRPRWVIERFPYVGPASPGEGGVHHGQPYIVYGDEVRVGGTAPWRANNPGISACYRSRFACEQGAIGAYGEDRFAVFPTPEAGRAAVDRRFQNFLENQESPGGGAGPERPRSRTLREAIRIYASSNSGNIDANNRETAPYFADVRRSMRRNLGRRIRIGADTPLERIMQDPVAHKALIMAVTGREGMTGRRNEGQVYRCGTDPAPPGWVRHLLNCPE